MKRRVLTFAGALVALTVAASHPFTGAQQTSPATWSAPLTPWGDPDLEGYSMTTTLSGARALDKSASTALSSGGRPVRVQPAHFHHLHLNSLDPRAAIEYYARAFSTVTKTRLAGFDGFTTTSRMSSGQGNVVVLISKTDTPPAIKPQSAISHFGWNVPDSRAYLDKFHALKLRVVPMYADADGTLVENSSDALPGYLTKAQIVDARSKGTKAVRKGGFHYLEGPDGALIESYGDFPAERFTHIHMYHSDPVCAQQWYARHLGATVAATHLHLGPGGPSGSGAGAQDCRRRFAEPTYPAFGPQGRVREPSGYILFDDVGLPMWPYDGPLVTTRRQTVDHIGLSVADLAATLARLRAEGVKVIEQTYQWGNTRAAMIEGPDHVALELIEGN